VTSRADTDPRTPIDILRRARYPGVEQTVSARDAMLYALGIGIGSDPLDPHQLRYVYEDGLQVFPTMAVTLCYPQPAADGKSLLGLDARRVLHLYQRFELLRPIPIGRRLVGQTETTGVIDKGARRGLVWTYRNQVRDAVSGETVALLDGASLSRDGGSGEGGPRGATPGRAIPERAPDIVADYPTLPQAALIYRLSGDYNPFHVDARLAREGGFDRPILHGRCTFGIAGRAIVDHACDHDGARLGSMEARFTASVFPGETVRVELWRGERSVHFRARVPARDAVVLDHGHAELR
jgi:acyl dehydratase